MTAAPHFGMVAGEPSGDALGAALMAALARRYPAARFSGIGGPRMVAAGCESLVAMERLAVMGFVEPIARLPELLRIKRRLEEHFLAAPPTAFVGIDAPDFNLRVAARLKRAGIPTVHYVSPSVWAYRSGRVRGIRRAVDLMLCLLPFEADIYRRHGVAVRYVGHPLADSMDPEDHRAENRARLGLPATAPAVALLPGSRGGEIKRLMPVFLAAAALAAQREPDLRFVVPTASAAAGDQVARLLGRVPAELRARCLVVTDSHAAMSAADFVLLASGTATLEALLLRRPMAVCYRLSPLTYLLAAAMVRIPHVALPNLLAGRGLVPEYIQHGLRAPALAEEMLRGIRPDPGRAQLLAEFARCHGMLRRDASATAAAAIAELVENGGVGSHAAAG